MNSVVVTHFLFHWGKIKAIKWANSFTLLIHCMVPAQFNSTQLALWYLAPDAAGGLVVRYLPSDQKVMGSNPQTASYTSAVALSKMPSLHTAPRASLIGGNPLLCSVKELNCSRCCVTTRGRFTCLFSTTLGNEAKSMSSST